MKKKNLFMLVLIITASYLSYNGIAYENAVMENTQLRCCVNGQCINLDCDYTCGMGIAPNEWPGTAMDCVDFGEAPFCYLDNGCEYWGPGDTRCDDLVVSISGPQFLYIPSSGSASASWSANVSGGGTPYTYSWSMSGTSGSSSSFSYTYYSTQIPGSGKVYLTVNSSDGQSVSIDKSLVFLPDN